MSTVEATNLPAGSGIAMNPTEYQTPINKDVTVVTREREVDSWGGVVPRQVWETTVEKDGKSGNKDFNYCRTTAILWHDITASKLKLLSMETEYFFEHGVQQIGSHTGDPDSAIGPFYSPPNSELFRRSESSR